jgi:hypothetical protein
MREPRPMSARKRQGGDRTLDRAIVVTTFRIYADQRDALHQEAAERRSRGDLTRVDASAVLRELLDKHGVSR